MASRRRDRGPTRCEHHRGKLTEPTPWASDRLASTDLDTARTAFESYGTVVLPLSASPVFEQFPGVRSIVAAGELMITELMITVDDDGQLGVPFRPADSAEILLVDAPTLEELRAQASRHPDN